MLVPSSSERRCCRSNERVWNKAVMPGNEGHLREDPPRPHSGYGVPLHPESYSPCLSVPGFLKSPRLEVGFPGPGLLDRLLSSQA